MRKFWSALIVLLLLAPLDAVSADTISVSQEIHLRGIVPAMRFIIVNGQGSITEITSNTPQAVTPKVYLNSLQSGTQLPLTPALLKDYEAKIAGKDMHSTDLHFTPSSQARLSARKPNWLTALNKVSWLNLASRL